MDGDAKLIICVLFCFVFPPIAVALKEGNITINFWLNVLLTIFGLYFLGLIHALYVVFKS